MADDEELLGGLFGSSGLFSGGGQPPWVNALSGLASIPTRQERLMGRGRGGGYAYQPPDNRVQQAAMLRERQQQAEVDDLMRVQEMYGQALEWSPDDAEESLKHVMHLYQNASEPFKTTTGARAFIGMIPEMRKAAAQARAGKSERAGIEGAWSRAEPMATPDDFAQLLIANGVDPRLAISLAAQRGKNIETTTPTPGTFWRGDVRGRGTPQTGGIGITLPTPGGMPGVQYEFDPQNQLRGRIIPGPGMQPKEPIVEWTGQEGQAAPPEMGIQHRPESPPIMPPGLEMAAPDQPINLRRPGMPEPMGDRPIDPGRPVIPGLPGPLGLGGRSVEETVGFNLENGQTVLLPTIVQGQRVTPQQAIALYRMGRNEPVGAYGGPQEAETAAQARSQRIGQMLGSEGAPSGAGPRTLYTPPVPTPLPGMEPDTQKIGDVTYKRRPGGEEKLSQAVLDILATQEPAPAGEPRRQQIAAAVERVENQRKQVSEGQGARGVEARLAAERGVPLAQKGLREGRVVWDLENRTIADELNQSMEDVRGKPHRYRAVSEKTADQLTSIGEMQDLLAEYDPLVKELAKEPGANFGRALELWGQTRLGQRNPGVAFEAMRGTVLRLAGAMQGSRVQLSDQDRKAVENMLPTTLDGLDSGQQKLEVVRRILGSMYNAHFGDTSGLASANATLRHYGGEGQLGQLPRRGPAEPGSQPVSPAAPAAGTTPKRQEYRRDKNGNLVPVP